MCFQCRHTFGEIHDTILTFGHISYSSAGQRIYSFANVRCGAHIWAEYGRIDIGTDRRTYVDCVKQFIYFRINLREMLLWPEKFKLKSFNLAGVVDCRVWTEWKMVRTQDERDCVETQTHSKIYTTTNI